MFTAGFNATVFFLFVFLLLLFLISEAMKANISYFLLSDY